PGRGQRGVTSPRHTCTYPFHGSTHPMRKRARLSPQFHSSMVPDRDQQSGQAAVETALTLPLLLFLVLGTLQLFLMFQARLMTEYAAYRAVREGSVSQGNCKRMLQAALVTLLPTFTKTTTAANLAGAFGARCDNKY